MVFIVSRQYFDDNFANYLRLNYYFFSEANKGGSPPGTPLTC